MIELSRHIEILLLKNECVIVPDFGGFMTHYVSATYSNQEHLFIPPMRTLGFNPQLRMNDSVLAQSYVEAYDISYPEAIRRIEEEVDEMKEVLNEKGSYTLNDLGELTINQEGKMEFAPCQAGILSPELYGLTDFNFNTLKENLIVGNTEDKPEPVVAEEAKTVLLEVESNKEDKEDETKESPILLDFADDDDSDIHIKKSWIRNTVAVAAAIIAFFLLSTPVVNSELGSSTMSNIQNHILYKLIPQDTNIMNAKPVKVEMDKKVAEQKADSMKQVAKTVTMKKAKADSSVVNKTTYLIVLASQVKKNNAEIFVEQLHKEGYPQAQLFIQNNVIRVVCGEYNTEAEAYRMVNKMSSKEEFADAWVFKKKAQI